MSTQHQHLSPTTPTKITILGFIRDNFYVPDDTPLTDETSLLEQGIVDSTGVLEIVGFLEDTFDIEVQDEEILPENLDTVACMTAYVDNKLAGQ